MTRRRWLIIIGVLFVAVAGVGVYLLTPPKPGVTCNNFRRLHKGMRIENVRKELGSDGELQGWHIGMYLFQWRREDKVIEIRFIDLEAQEGNFSSKAEKVARLPDYLETISEKLHRWVKDWTGW